MSPGFITANYDEDVVLELCKQLAWQRSYVQGAKIHNRSWPQVIPLLEVLPHLMQAPATKDRFKVILQGHGNLLSFLQKYLPGRRNEQDTSAGFEAWGYELITCARYMQDDRYSAEIFPTIHTVDPHQQLMVIYPPFFAAVFEAKLPVAAGRNPSPRTHTSFPSFTPNVSHSPVRHPITQPTTPATQNHYLNAQATEYQPEAATPPMAASDDLSMEIMELVKSCVPSHGIARRRERLMDRIAGALRNRYPRTQLRVEIFGSSATGLDFEDSDLDLCIIVPPHLFRNDITNLSKRQREYNSYYNMHCIASVLRNLGMANVLPIAKATVPICKFEDPYLNLKADINTQHDMGVENSRMIKEYVYLEPRVRPFLYAIKTFAKKRDINSSSQDTISSYTYVLMGLFYLMTCNPPVIPNLQDLGFNDCGKSSCKFHREKKETCYRNELRTFDVRFHTCVNVLGIDQPEPHKPKSKSKPTTWRCLNTQSLGELLTGFFSYYGHEHNYNRAVSIFRGETITRRNNWNKGPGFAVQDPFILDRNVAATCTYDGFDRIIDEFQRAYRQLEAGASFGTICAPIPTLSGGNQMTAIPVIERKPAKVRSKKAVEMEKAPMNSRNEKVLAASYKKSSEFLSLYTFDQPESLSDHSSNEPVPSERHHLASSYRSNTSISDQGYYEAEESDNSLQNGDESEEEDYLEEDYGSSDKIVDDLATAFELSFQPLSGVHAKSNASCGSRKVSNEDHVAKNFQRKTDSQPYKSNYQVEEKPKKATLKLVEMPYYVDKLDIVEAMESCGLEVITIRCEPTGAGGEHMPVLEWLVRVTGGLNEDLPFRFELQNMIMTQSYRSKRLITYKGIPV